MRFDLGTYGTFLKMCYLPIFTIPKASKLF
jgi:hypothetical protein